MAIHQAFDGDISGCALLIFPESNSLELVRAITGGEFPLEDIIDLEQEALAETGNIILNGCLATIANMLQRSLKVSLPEVLRGSGPYLFELSGATVSEQAVLFLYINFSVKRRDIRGYIAMLMDLPALASLKLLLGELIRPNHGRGVGDRCPDLMEANSRACSTQSTLGLIVLDEDARVLGWNVWMAFAARIAAETALGRRLDELFPGITTPRLSAAVAEALTTGTSSLLTHSLHPGILPLKTRAGRPMLHNVYVHPLKAQTHRALIQVMDVTVATERDQVLRKRQDARYNAVVERRPIRS